MNIANVTVGSAVADGGSPAGSPGAPCRGAPVGAPAGGGGTSANKTPTPLRLLDFPSFSKLSWEVPCCFLPCLGVVLDFLMVSIRILTISRSSFQLNVALGEGERSGVSHSRRILGGSCEGSKSPRKLEK